MMQPFFLKIAKGKPADLPPLANVHRFMAVSEPGSPRRPHLDHDHLSFRQSDDIQFPPAGAPVGVQDLPSLGFEETPGPFLPDASGLPPGIASFPHEDHPIDRSGKSDPCSRSRTGAKLRR